MTWMEDAGLEGDMLTNESLATIPDVKTLAKTYIDTKASVGASIRIPSEEAGDDDWNKFNEKILSKTKTLIPKPDLEKPENVAQLLQLLGQPKEADGYDFTGVSVEDFKVPEGMLTNLQKMAHAAGLTNAQGKVLAKTVMEDMHKTNVDDASKLSVGRTELMKEWGLAFDQKSNDAVAILKKTGAPADLITLAEKGEVGAETLRWASALASAFGGEGTPFSSETNNDNTPDKLTPGDARARITEIYTNKDHPYNNRNDPGHKDAMLKMVDYHRMANA